MGRLVALWLVVMIALAALPCPAQTTTPPGIDVEVYNPADGGSRFCVAPGESFWANVLVRPGPVSTSCTLSCSPPDVAGGSANLATGVIDLAFDSARLGFVQVETNPDPASVAVDGLPQEQNVSQGRIGWALAGDWLEDGNPASGLKDPCAMRKLDAEAWVFRVRFTAAGTGMAGIHLRRETDVPAFALSFADMCGSGAFTESSGGIDEVGDATVLISPDCDDVIFFDGLDRGDTAAWSTIAGR